jgi:hypothetical protein
MRQSSCVEEGCRRKIYSYVAKADDVKSAVIKPIHRLLRSVAAPNTKLLPILSPAEIDKFTPQNPAGAKWVVLAAAQRCLT